MTRVTVDAATAAKLSSQGECLELCDEAGNILGRFEPDPKSPAFREWLRNLDPGISQEEIERRIADRSGGFTTEEVLARLRSQRS
jgi:hypothetical protein